MIYEYQKQTDSILEAFRWMPCTEEEATHYIVEVPSKSAKRFNRIKI